MHRDVEELRDQPASNLAGPDPDGLGDEGGVHRSWRNWKGGSGR